MHKYIEDDEYDRACSEIPELARLTPKLQKFIWEWTHNGCHNKRAALSAGYAEKSAPALLQRQEVIDAITALTDRMLHAAALPAIMAVDEIVRDPHHKDRLKAASMILNRTGWPEVMEHRVKVEKVPDEAAMVSAAIDLAKKLGIDPVSLVGPNTPVIALQALPEPARIDDGSDI